jgi:hypothetical protein
MEEYVSKPTLDDGGSCNCIGPENCENTDCRLVQDYLRRVKDESND